MCFVHEQLINAQFFKADHVVLAAAVVEAFQPPLQRFAHFLQLLNGVAFAVLAFGLINAVYDLVDLIFNDRPLPLRGERNLLKLTVTNDDGIIITGSNPAAKGLAVGRFKVPFGRHQNVRTGIQTQEVRAPLFGQVIRNHHQAFLHQPQPPGFHCRRDTLEGLACPHTVRQQRISTIKHPGHSIALVRQQADLRRHAGETEMVAVIFARADGVEQFVVLLAEGFPAFRVFPNPAFERLADHILPLLGQDRFLGVQLPCLSAIWPGDGIIYPAVPQVQAVLNDGVCAAPLGAVGHIGQRVFGAVQCFPGNTPFAGGLRIKRLYIPTRVQRRFQQLVDKLRVIPGVDPGRADTHVDLGGGKVSGLCLLQSRHIFRESVILLRRRPCRRQLPAYIAGKVFVCRLPAV